MLPEFHAKFPHTAATVTAKDMYAFINKASAGLIRVDADELTYSMVGRRRLTLGQTRVDCAWCQRLRPKCDETLSSFGFKFNSRRFIMHVVLRFEIERAIFTGEAQVADLPALWKLKMKELLGVVPETDTLGVLQDVHWSDGSFGYFPSYTLGRDGRFADLLAL
jgi:carboxypeptidase Taq